MAEYKFSITLKKALIVALEVIVAGTVVYLTDNNLYLGLIPLLEIARNWFKNRNK